MRNLIVGVDGTRASSEALAWAAATVGNSGRLRAVVAVNPWTEQVVDTVTGAPLGYRDLIDSAMVEEWTSEARFAVGELVTSVSSSAMGSALDRAASEDGADAIVVGAHQSVGGIVKRVGHATNRLLRLTRHPVIVVPLDTQFVVDGGNVVVGIGHGDATRSAVRWTAQLAQHRDFTIELLHATDDAPVFQAEGLGDLVRYETGRTDQTAWEAGRIEHFAELLLALGGPELDVVVSTPSGLAAFGLDEASERSSLLVIGRHRSKLDRGHHTGQPLRHVLAHSRCPVAVIPDHLAGDIGFGG